MVCRLARLVAGLTMIVAACDSDDVPADPGHDAGADATPADAGRDAGHPSGDAAGEEFPELCLGIGCDVPFDAANGSNVGVTAAGALELSGDDAGELRHVFEPDCQGLVPLWSQITVTGSLDGVSLEVRGANRTDELENEPWLPAVPGEDVPDVAHGAGCGPFVLEVRILLRAASPPPRVDTLRVFFGCVAIFC